MNTKRKCTIKELKIVWEKVGWRIFARSEDYVVEVRRYETDIKYGRIKLSDLRDENKTKLNKLKHV